VNDISTIRKKLLALAQECQDRDVLLSALVALKMPARARSETTHRRYRASAKRTMRSNEAIVPAVLKAALGRIGEQRKLSEIAELAGTSTDIVSLLRIRTYATARIVDAVTTAVQTFTGETPKPKARAPRKPAATPRVRFDGAVAELLLEAQARAAADGVPVADVLSTAGISDIAAASQDALARLREVLAT
jgi:hypothetical protein